LYLKLDAEGNNDGKITLLELLQIAAKSKSKGGNQSLYPNATVRVTVTASSE
jgi:hypothetical protein